MHDTRNHQAEIEHELLTYSPEQWRPNIPGRHYRIRPIDLVPALAGTIGKISLVAAFAMAWASAFGISDPSFVTENVRLELWIACFFTLLFSVFLNPTAGPPGTLAPLIPLIPVMAQSGVHPLPFAILISVVGFLFAQKGFFREIIRINGPATKSGILLLFGILGVSGAFKALHLWINEHSGIYMLVTLLFSGTILYLLLLKLHLKWLIIPAVAVLSLVIALVFGVTPVLATPVGLPIVDPFVWWQDKWGIGFGLSLENFLVCLPFVLLVMTMWPTDALAVQALQEANYPPGSQKAVLNMDASFVGITIRNLTGALLGGAQTAAVWRSFMIPLSVVRRPIGGAALFLAILCAGFAFLGFPIDLAVFPPLVWLVLLFGVFMPMLEIGSTGLKQPGAIPVILLCLVIGISLGPLPGWSAALVTENLFLHKKSSSGLSRKDKIYSLIVLLVSMGSLLLTR